ncbi:hypothetical protein AGR4A_pAt30019 [Agrobacterium tumefaciens str. B6]|uniref:Uncharacterized protein n=1 Tax=Agrobacterium tumefaciens str. B6 TaxID=1183423 RepID=A0A822VEI3_AGRTU|nr:hypothetical protein AGR4A_pAt30019 [Agrobacterium tumefaciens str. B6]
MYNTRRPHSSLDRQTPDQAYFNAGTDDGGGISKAEIHLEKRPKLFRQTEPPLTAIFEKQCVPSDRETHALLFMSPSFRIRASFSFGATTIIPCRGVSGTPIQNVKFI